MKIQKNEAGYTLMEVIIGTVLITIILLSFFMFFINSMKTTKTSNTILDATYYAQQEMERIYQLSQMTSFANREHEITYLPPRTPETLEQYEANKNYYYSKIGSSDSFEKLGNKSEDPNNYYYYHLTIVAKELRTTKVILKLYDEKNGVLKAQMEGLYEWRANE